MPIDYGIRAEKANPLVNSAILTTAIASADLDVAGAKTLTVVLRLRATTTTTDMNASGVRPYLPDGTTLVALGLNPVSGAPVSDGTDVYAIYVYDLRGLQRVRAQFQNNNAGTKSADIYYFLGY